MCFKEALNLHKLLEHEFHYVKVPAVKMPLNYKEIRQNEKSV